MTSFSISHQAVKFAKKVAIFTAYLCFLLPAYANNDNVSKIQLCTYFYDFNFNDPLLKKQDIRRAVKAMVLSNLIKSEKGEINHHILPKSLQFENESYWSPIVIEQLLNRNNVTPKSPLQFKIVYENQKIHSTIARQMIRALIRSD